MDSTGKVLLEIPERSTETIYSNVNNPIIGKSFYVGDSLVNDGMDFTFKNKLALSDLHGVVERIIFPMSFVEFDRFTINES